MFEKCVSEEQFYKRLEMKLYLMELEEKIQCGKREVFF